MGNSISYVLLALLIFVISLLIYFLIKWAVREGIKEAYHDITGKTTYEDKKNIKMAKEIKEGIKERRCEKCGRTHWFDDPIVLELHHIDGNKTNNSLENLQLLCPNCHSHTDNFKSKKLKQYKKLENN